MTIRLLVAVLLILGLLACKGQKGATGSASKAETSGSDYAVDPAKVIATIDGQKITESDIAKRIQNDLHFEYEKIYQLKKRAIEEVVDEKLIKAKADEQKKTPEAYMEESGARREAERGTFDPTYLVYSVGKLMLLKLRQDYKQLQGKAYSLRTFHDTLLGNGTAPFWLHRQLMLGADSDDLLD